MATRALSLTTMTEGQANKYITHNTALHELDTWVGGVKSRTNSGPPGSPATGDAYIVDSLTGAWASGFSLEDLAVYYLDSGGAGAWLQIDPVEGPSLFVEDEDIYVYYSTSGGEWRAIGALSIPEDVPLSSPATRTLALTDNNKVLRFTSSSAMTCEVPTESSVNFALGSTITIRRAGTGAVTISTAAGSPQATINGSTTLAAQHDSVTLMKVGANEWDAY